MDDDVTELEIRERLESNSSLVVDVTLGHMTARFQISEDGEYLLWETRQRGGEFEKEEVDERQWKQVLKGHVAENDSKVVFTEVDDD